MFCSILTSTFKTVFNIHKIIKCVFNINRVVMVAFTINKVIKFKFDIKKASWALFIIKIKVVISISMVGYQDCFQ